MFVPFIIIASLSVLNLFIGVIVDAMQTEHEAEAREERGQMMSENELILEEIRAIRQELDRLRAEKV